MMQPQPGPGSMGPTIEEDVAFLRQAVEDAMAEKAKSLGKQKELRAQIGQLKSGHERVTTELQSKIRQMEDKVGVLEREVLRSQESEKMMRQQVTLLRTQVDGEAEQRAASEELCGALTQMLKSVTEDMERVEHEAGRLVAVEGELENLLSSPDLITSKIQPSDSVRARSPSMERAVLQAREVADLQNSVNKLETALCALKDDQQKVVRLARERCCSLASPEAQREIEESMAALREENRQLSRQIERVKSMHAASSVFEDNTEDEIYEEMIEEYAHTAGKVQTRKELVEAIELSQRHSENPFIALVDELYRSYKAMKRSLIKVKAEKVFLAEEITSLQVELDMTRLQKDEIDRARKQLCVELSDAKARYTKIQQLLSTIKKHPTFKQLTGKI